MRSCTEVPSPDLKRIPNATLILPTQIVPSKEFPAISATKSGDYVDQFPLGSHEHNFWCNSRFPLHGRRTLLLLVTDRGNSKFQVRDPTHLANSEFHSERIPNAMISESFMCPNYVDSIGYKKAQNLITQFNADENFECETSLEFLRYAERKYDETLCRFDAVDAKAERILYLLLAITTLLVGHHINSSLAFGPPTIFAMMTLFLGISICVGARAPINLGLIPEAGYFFKVIQKDSEAKKRTDVRAGLLYNRSTEALVFICNWKSHRVVWATLCMVIGAISAVLDIGTSL